MDDAKKQIRQRMLAVRRGLAPEDVAAKAEAITRQIRAMDAWRRTGTVLSYVDTPGNPDNEVPTRDLIQEAMAAGKQVLVPIARRGGIMDWSRLQSLDELGLSRFGVPEPRDECQRLTEPPRDALCLTPGIAFTPQGYRIGYGGGFYDRFLAGFHGFSLGLAFREQLIDDFPRNEYDIPVQTIVTDEGFIQPR